MAFNHISIDEELCNGCNECVEVCMCDVFAPNPEKGKPPLVMYPEECWFGGCCMSHCAQSSTGALTIITPFQMRGGFKRSCSMVR